MSPFIIYAHRGASLHYPENTFPAFRAAVQQGANGIEIDVHLTKDGHPVIIHDADLERTTNGKGRVSRHPLSEIKSLTAGKSFQPKYRNVRVPTLEEFLSKVKKFKKSLYINMELKNFLISYPGIEKKVLNLVGDYQLLDRCIFSSFNFHSLQKIKSLEPLARVALLYPGHIKEPWRFTKKANAYAIHPPVSEITEDYIRTAHENQLRVIPYTVDDSQMMVQLIRWEADGLITNDPQKARNIVRQLSV